MMDAPELEQDVQLERSAPNLLADLGQCLPPFLRRNGRIRRNVRVSDMDRLVNLLEPFQELPQLLDPHLNKFVPALANAFLEYLRAPLSKQPTTHHLLTPPSKAICKLLYTFCKIRGEKVIVQFFGTETRDLELLLSAIEKGTTWDWEERYITLLWLSQLLLAPFDLESISSQGTEVELDIPGFSCPPNVPTVTLRVISLAVRYLSSSGKERDAAKILLVRVAMRPDMQQVGVLQALVRWGISRLHPSAGPESSPYFYIGILSFLAGMLVSSAGTPDMAEYLPEIFDVTHDQDGPTTILDAIRKSAVSRKIIIKIFRAIALLELANGQDLERVQTVIGDLLDFLEDESTPVRLAASKALSIITLKLDPDMASQVVDVVLDTFRSTYRIVAETADLSDVKPFQWHGLVLTFSHLLYRRSIPPANLSPVLKALRLALSFEKRSGTSASTGTNVRDAANFGIWALARRYSTKEMQIVLDGLPAVQILATDLVVAGSLDPAGNVRRGSSAALQELIGRNPDMIAEGIQVVQVVDYHAIALRSRAVEVGIGAAALSDEYYRGLLDGLLGWRGVKDSNADVRRTAASAVGKLVREKPHDVRRVLQVLVGRLKELVIRDGDERHGVLLCIASIVGFSTDDVEDVLKYVDGSWATFRNQPLIAEATCRILIASPRITSSRLQERIVEKFLPMEDPFGVISEASASLVVMNPDLIVGYIEKAKSKNAYLSTLFKAYATSGHQAVIIRTIQDIWKRDKDPDSRAMILRCLNPLVHLEEAVRMVEEGLDDFTITAQGDVGSKVRIEAVKVAAVMSLPRLRGRVMRTAAEKLDKVRREGGKCLGLDSDPSSELYFRALLDMQLSPEWDATWSETFLSGYVTSVTGAFPQASRSALVSFCEAGNTVTLSLLALLGNSRVLVPALETIAFLLDIGVLQSVDVPFVPSSNMRRAEAYVRIYGNCARGKLKGMSYKYPRVRDAVRDELWEENSIE
ncbi:armadillo-type protein [Rhexocercosporidium sp. MPI-PUGE-AT-0058]|nr:armadillo-type protein [Rhexocercosporidium sp. MPI-PUGE-AT-0058]